MRGMICIIKVWIVISFFSKLLLYTYLYFPFKYCIPLEKFREALQKYTEAINAHPNDYYSWSNRAITHIKVINFFTAVKVL